MAKLTKMTDFIGVFSIFPKRVGALFREILDKPWSKKIKTSSFPALCLAQFRVVADKTVDLYSECPSLFNHTDPSVVPSVDRCRELSCEAGANVFNWSVVLYFFTFLHVN